MSLVELGHVDLSYVAIDDIHEKPVLVFCPGIMGNKKNLDHFVRKLLKALPKYSAVIFDLRNHGDSSKHCAPFTVEACADDVVLALEKLKVRAVAVFGHSFGGKVALMIAKKMPLKQVWLLDTPPGRSSVKPLGKNSLTAFEIMAKLQETPWPKASRNDVVKDLSALEVPREIALWMTTNLISKADGLYLNFEPDEVQKMLLDFIALDLWPEVAKVSQKTAVHIVEAKLGHRFTLGDKEKFLSLKRLGSYQVLPDSGHFVHVDNPDGLIQIIKTNFDS